MWAVEIEHYCRWLAAAGSGKETLRLRRHYLRRLGEVHPGGPWTLTLDDLVSYVAKPGWAPETRKAARGALRGFYSWGCRTDRVGKDPALGLPAIRIPPPQPRPAPDNVLATAMMAAAPREQTMLLLASLAGLRRGEIASLQVRDIVGNHAYVTGKGSRERRLPIHPTLAIELAREMAGRLDGPVFPGQIDGHLSPGHVGVMLSRLLGPGWSAHKLRHRFASRTYAVDRDILAVQRLLGHSTPETTTRYVVVPDDSLWAAVMAA